MIPRASIVIGLGLLAFMASLATPVEAAVCGDGIINQVGETCEPPGAPAGGNGNLCRTDCTVCGDGIVQPGEFCDDGNGINGDACTNSCTIPGAFCGDGAVNQPGETCEPPGTPAGGNGNLCRFNCTVCGDTIVQPGEVCDDGNGVNGDACSNSCTSSAATCGDGIINQVGETCEPPGALAGGNGNLCRANCTVCGDAFLQPGEACDDGNGVNGDGCNNDCFCGDGIINGPGETCEPPGTPAGGNGNLCRINCTVCGDTVIQPGEACDDGNGANGDGCQNNCTVTTTTTTTTLPSTTTTAPPPTTSTTAASTTTTTTVSSTTTTVLPPTTSTTAASTSTTTAVVTSTTTSTFPPAAIPCMTLVYAPVPVFPGPDQNPAKAQIIIKNLNEPLGTIQGIVAKGFFNPAAGVPPIDPEVNGVHARLVDAGGTLVDVSIPPGPVGSSACDPRDGWTTRVRPSGIVSWKYKNVSGAIDSPTCTPGSARGIYSVFVKDLTVTSKAAFQYIVKSRNDSGWPYVPAVPPTLVQFDLALGAQPAPGAASAQAIAGQCAESVFSGAPIPGTLPSPFCRVTPPAGPVSLIVCKGR